MKFVLFALFSLMLVPPAMADDRPEMPNNPVEIQGLRRSVLFPHDVHQDSACVDCHHEVEGRETYEKCASAGCHDNLESKESPALRGIIHTKKGLKRDSCAMCHIRIATPETRKRLLGCKESGCHE